VHVAKREDSGEVQLNHYVKRPLDLINLKNVMLLSPSPRLFNQAMRTYQGGGIAALIPSLGAGFR
jgi:hypothetical protein